MYFVHLLHESANFTTCLQPIRIILETLIHIIPDVWSILLLLFLVIDVIKKINVEFSGFSERLCSFDQIYSMFATLFVQVFGSLKYGERIGGTANFESFTTAMLTIYQLVTGVIFSCGMK